jgi:hypothetical protein
MLTLDLAVQSAVYLQAQSHLPVQSTHLHASLDSPRVGTSESDLHGTWYLDASSRRAYEAIASIIHGAA